MSTTKLQPQNLDALDVSDLAELEKTLLDAPGALGIRDKTRRLLLAYVEALGRAKRLRLSGKISAAIANENHCAYLYKQLPRKWRW